MVLRMLGASIRSGDAVKALIPKQSAGMLGPSAMLLELLTISDPLMREDQ